MSALIRADIEMKRWHPHAKSEQSRGRKGVLAWDNEPIVVVISASRVGSTLCMSPNPCASARTHQFPLFPLIVMQISALLHSVEQWLCTDTDQPLIHLLFFPIHAASTIACAHYNFHDNNKVGLVCCFCFTPLEGSRSQSFKIFLELIFA